jgi:hypothetical protein
MFSMDTQSLPSSKPTTKRSRRSFYAIVSAIVVVIILYASFLVAPPGETMDLRLDYSVGERMVYDKTEVIVNQSLNMSAPETVDTDTFNSTINIEVLSETAEGYVISENQAIVNVSRNPLLSVLLPSGAPLIFWNASSSPTLGPYFEETSIRTGDVWTLPLDCANASLGLTGTVTVTYAAIEEVTVPAGTYRAIRIEIQSSILTINPDSQTPYQKGMTLQFNATTYLEQTTCRLIKTELSQETHLNTSGVDAIATVHIEQVLTQQTKP